MHQPLVSCLVNGHTSSTSTSTPTPKRPLARRPSLPLPPRPDVVTIPLRACCRECYPITEECVKEGAAWEEKFTRGARRRRNSSADSHAHAHAARHRRVCDDVPGFGAIVSVDEVDKRHHTSSAAPSTDTAASSSSNAPQLDDTDLQLLPSFSRRLHLSSDGPASPMPIAEEEAEDSSDGLFPLPPPSACSPPYLPAHTELDAFTLRSQGHTTKSDVAAAMAIASGLRALPSPTDEPDDEALEHSPSSAYYTPEMSPAVPYAWQSPPSPRESASPVTPPPPSHEPRGGIPIPHHTRRAMYASDEFEFVDSPTPRSTSWRDDALPSPSSPSQSDGSMSPGGRKKQFMNLPGPGTFFRAGADLWKGVTAIGSSPMPLTV